MKQINNLAAIDTTEARKWIADLLDVEKRIAELNESKSAVYKHVNASYGNAAKNGLKGAIRQLRADPDRRQLAKVSSEYESFFVKTAEAKATVAGAEGSTALTDYANKATALAAAPDQATIAASDLVPIVDLPDSDRSERFADAGDIPACLRRGKTSSAPSQIDAVDSLEPPHAANSNAISAGVEVSAFATEGDDAAYNDSIKSSVEPMLDDLDLTSCIQDAA